MVICEKCKKLCDCKDGEIFLSLKKSIHLGVTECGNFEEKEFTKKKANENNMDMSNFIKFCINFYLEKENK